MSLSNLTQRATPKKKYAPRDFRILFENRHERWDKLNAENRGYAKEA